MIILNAPEDSLFSIQGWKIDQFLHEGNSGSLKISTIS